MRQEQAQYHVSKAGMANCRWAPMTQVLEDVTTGSEGVFNREEVTLDP